MWGDGLWGWSGARLKGWGASAAINGPPPAWRSLPPRDGAHSSGRWQRSARQQQSWPPRAARPAFELPSQVVSQPSSDGPKKPPRFPAELIAAIPAATAAPVSMDPGKLQNSAIAVRLPAIANVMKITVKTVLSAKYALRIRPMPPRMEATVACHRFSLVRSAWRVAMIITPTLIA